jgi:hypothetical protein
MKKFVNSFIAGLKTKRVAQQKAPLDGSDFMALRATPPSTAELRAVVTDRLFKTAPPVTSEAESLHRAAATDGLVFDLKFRCCGAGRCIYNDLPCRFPQCFDMRPLSKGAEVKDVRALYEIHTDAAQLPGNGEGTALEAASLNAIVDVMLKDQDPERGERSIRELAQRMIRIAAYGRPLARDLASEWAGDHLDISETYKGPLRAEDETNPLNENEKLREDIVSLYIWRAALLVNARKDVAAVNSLLNLSYLLPVNLRTRLLMNATMWAYYSDKEVIYYRNFIQIYPSIEVAQHLAHNRSMLLRRVFAELARCSTAKDDFLFAAAIEMVISKEVLCIVTSAHAAQTNKDITEDPMKSAQIPLTLHYFRFHISDVFWMRFLHMLLLPPMPPPAGEDADPSREIGMTPKHIFDAMGRSMLLHHLLKLSHQRDSDIASGAVSPDMQTKRRLYDIDADMQTISMASERTENADEELRARKDEYMRYLEGSQTANARLRLRQLLTLVREYETKQAELSGNKPWNLLGLNRVNRKPASSSPQKEAAP